MKFRTVNLPQSVAQAAANHFRAVGISQATINAFRANCADAGIKVGRKGDTVYLVDTSAGASRQRSTR